MTTASPPSALDGTPLLLDPELRLSPAQLAPLCEANPDAVLDLSATGQLIQITTAGGDTPAHATPCRCTPCSKHYARTHGGLSGQRRPARLVVLIPDQQAVEVWRASNSPAAAPERLKPPVAILADPLLFGLHLELAELRAA